MNIKEKKISPILSPEQIITAESSLYYFIHVSLHQSAPLLPSFFPPLVVGTALSVVVGLLLQETARAAQLNPHTGELTALLEPKEWIWHELDLLIVPALQTEGRKRNLHSLIVRWFEVLFHFKDRSGKSTKESLQSHISGCVCQ